MLRIIRTPEKSTASTGSNPRTRVPEASMLFILVTNITIDFLFNMVKCVTKIIRVTWLLWQHARSVWFCGYFLSCYSICEVSEFRMAVVVKITVFRDVTNSCYVGRPLYQRFQEACLRIAVFYLPNSTASHPRRHQSSVISCVQKLSACVINAAY